MNRWQKSAVAALLLLAVGAFVFFDSRVSSLPKNPNAQTKTDVHSQQNFAKKSTARANVPHSFSPAKKSDFSTSFPDAVVVDSREESLGNNEIRRVELLKTPMKYPFIRVETHWRIDPITQEETKLSSNEIVADHVMVQLRPGKVEADLLAAAQPLGGTIRKKLKLNSETFLVALPEPTLDAVPDAIRNLSARPEILKIAEGDGVQHLLRMPGDPQISKQWPLNNVGQTGGKAHADIAAAEAWNLQTGNSSVVIAFSDTGMDYTHPDLRENVWTNPGETPGNFSDEDRNGYTDDIQGWDFASGDNMPMDDVGHGTHVAGIVGASGNNGVGISGVCWRCRMMPLRVLDQYGGFDSDIAEAFNYARNKKVSIVNASHGGGNYSQVLKSAVDDLQSAGILLVAAAGNENANTDSNPLYPASFPNPNVISVGYTDDADEVSPYSNYGLRSVDLFAPGVATFSTAAGGSYGTKSGSSFAAPHVTGVAALLKAQNPSWNYTQLRNAILRNVDPLPQLRELCVTGGRLNAFKAFRGPLSLAEALDGPGLTWTTGGAAGWWGQRIATHDGLGAAASGDIFANQTSWIETTITGPGTLDFWWKVSCESSGTSRFDYLQLIVDGTEQGWIDGETDWQHRTVSIPAGSHTARWRYVKDNYVTRGQDRAWLDQVVFTGVPLTFTAQPESRTAFPGNNVILSASVSGTPPFTYQWSKNGINISGATQAGLTLNNVQTNSAGIYSVKVSNRFGAITSSPATLTICDYTLSANGAAYDFNGGNGNFIVTSGCSWSVTNTNTWIFISSGQNGDGQGEVNYQVAPNASNVPRVGYLKIGNKTFTVSQDGRFAPETAAGKNFTFTITNASGDFASSGSFVLAAKTTENAYQIFSLSGATTNSSGTFDYAVSDGKNASLTLSNNGDPLGVALVYDSAVSGTFEITNNAGDFQSGHFASLTSAPDFSGDGLFDLTWQNSAGQLAAWAMNGTNFLKSVLLADGKAATVWRAVGAADFNADGSPDVLFQNSAGKMAVWQMDGPHFLSSVLIRNGTAAGIGWRAVGTGDFNNDSWPDILFQHDDGRAAVWLLKGTEFLGGIALRNGQSPGTGWRIVALGDFNGDNQKDIIWQHSSGKLLLWQFVGTEFTKAAYLRNGTAVTAGWRVAAVADFDRDGKNDLLFRHDNGKLAVWFMDGPNFLGSIFLRDGQPASPGWRVFGPN